MAVMELNIDEDMFREWYRDTAEVLETPPIDRLLDFMEKNSRVIVPSWSKPKSTPSVPKKPRRATAYHVHEQNACQLCQGSHFLFQCSTFKAQSLEQRSATVQRLKVCHNCLSLDHFAHSYPSRKTCRECNQHCCTEPSLLLLLHLIDPPSSSTTSCVQCPYH